MPRRASPAASRPPSRTRRTGTGPRPEGARPRWSWCVGSVLQGAPTAGDEHERGTGEQHGGSREERSRGVEAGRRQGGCTDGEGRAGAEHELPGLTVTVDDFPTALHLGAPLVGGRADGELPEVD